MESFIAVDCMLNVDKDFMKQTQNSTPLILTAGSTYLDIDAYACIVAMTELLRLKGENAVAYSSAPCNYSVCRSLAKDGQIERELPCDLDVSDAKYIILDVSDPVFLTDSVPLDRVIGIYDHHVGFEDFWKDRIGDDAHIEFIGAAATLVFREWKLCGIHEKMTRATALLLIAAILDNTLDLTSSNTTDEDVEAFKELCRMADVGDDFRAAYFSEVQSSVEADLENALFGDIKTVRDNTVLPPRMAQLSVWDAGSILARLPEIRTWFEDNTDGWLINVIDIKDRCSYFVCEDIRYQEKIEDVFGVRFDSGFARSDAPYLRKQIIKKTISRN